jgi:hypothetical protein
MSDSSPFGPRPQALLEKADVVAYLLQQKQRGYEVYQAQGGNGRYDLMLDGVHRVTFNPPTNGGTQVQGYVLNNIVQFFNVTSMIEFTRAVDSIAQGMIGARWQQSPLAGRVREDTPASNFVAISNLIGGASVVAVFDPYLENRSLIALLDILSFGSGSIANGVRVLSTSKTISGQVPRLTKNGFEAWLAQLRVTGELRLMASSEHRRFMLLSSGRSLLLGHSLNAIHKNEAIRLEPSVRDQAFFDQVWAQAVPIS